MKKFAVKWFCVAAALLGYLFHEKSVIGNENLPVTQSEYPAEQPIDQILEELDKEEGEYSILNDEFFNSATQTSQPFDASKRDLVQINGSLELITIYNFAHDQPEKGEIDWRGFSSLATEFGLEVKAALPNDWYVKGRGHVMYDFIYDLRGDDCFTEQVLDEHKNELELDEFYLSGSLLPSLDLKLGRQIVVWGSADLLRVTDVINPLDMRELGITDIEDLRLPLTMARLDGYFGSWNLTCLAINEIKFDKLPGYGHDFYPASVPLTDDIPGSSFENIEYGLALKGIFSGWGISFYWTDMFDDTAHAEVANNGNLTWSHSRLNMLGVASDVALNNVLLKSEIAHFRGIEFSDFPGQSWSRTDIMIGLDYSGLKNTTVSIEAVNRHLHDFDQGLKEGAENARRNVWQVGLQVERKFVKDTLAVSLSAFMVGVENEMGGYERLELKYSLNDFIEISAGAVLYQSVSQPMLEDINDNDRLFFKVKYSF